MKKHVTHVDVSSFAFKTNLGSLKSNVDKINADELKTIHVDLLKLSNVVKNDVVRRTYYDGLVTKVNNIDTAGFVLKTKYNADISGINQTLEKGGGVASQDDLDAVKNKIPNVSGFLLIGGFNSKITEVENKIPDIKNLARKTEVIAVENEIPNVSNLVTKTDYTVEITKIKNDYVTNATSDARHKDLVQKTTFETELKDVDDKVSGNSSKVLPHEHKLKQREDTIHDLERDISYFGGKNYFGDDGKQNYFVFQPMYKCFNTVYIHYWQSKGLSDEKVKY